MILDWIADHLHLIIGAIIAVIIASVGWYVYEEIREPDSGLVIEKNYHAAWTQIVCTTTNNVTNCTPIYHPECYEIIFINSGSRGDACVSPLEWQEIQINSQFEK